MIPQFIIDDAQKAESFVADCKRFNNRTAENYKERVNAFRCIAHYEFLVRAEKNPVSSGGVSNETVSQLHAKTIHQKDSNMAKERQQKPLPEFVKITTVGQAVAGVIDRFGMGTLGGAFVVLSPAYIRDKKGGDWLKFGELAVNLSADMSRKIDNPKDKGEFVVFNYVENEPTKQGGHKKIFKVLLLEPDEIKSLDRRAKNMGNVKPEVMVATRPDDEDETHATTTAQTDEDLGI